MPITATDAPKNLPKHAKEIYVSAFNNAWSTTCKKPEDRRDPRDSRDACAAKVAWSAVKKKYKQVGDKWTAKAISLGEQERRVRDSWYATHHSRREVAVGPVTEEDEGWVREVFEDSVIVQRGGKLWRYSYTHDDGDIQFGEPAEVEIEYVEKAVRAKWARARGEGQGQGGDRQGEGPPDKCVCPKCGATVKHKPNTPCSTVECPKCGATMEGKDEKKASDLWAVKSLGEDRIGQYAARWGDKDSPDLVGEFFTPETDFWLGAWPSVPMLYHHGFNDNPDLVGRKSVVGRWDTFKSDDIGLWVEGELKKAHTYREAIGKLIGEKALWLSSAALPRYDCIVIGDDGHIKSWPIIEVSLTPTPMEPRMADVAFLKANFEFGIDLDTIERKELIMSDKGKKNLWQAVGEAFGRALGRLEEPEEPVAPEKAKEPQEDSPDAELDTEDAKALAVTIGETVIKAVEGRIEAFEAQFETRFEDHKAEIDSRMSDTEKAAETKVAEIMERLPPVVASPVSESVAAVAGPTKAPKKESDFMNLVADLVKTGLANQILTPTAEVE